MRMTPARLMPSLVSSLISSSRSMSAGEYMRVLPLVRWGAARRHQRSANAHLGHILVLAVL